MVHSEVQQESVLGPLLFLMKSSSFQECIYADDMLMYKPITCSISYEKIQQDVHQLPQWSDVNMLSFNTNKCKCLLLSNKSTPPIIFNSDVLESVHQYKYLNVTISSNLC